MVAPALRARDEFQAYYTNCNHITSFMVSLLKTEGASKVLEPCAGEGAFVEPLLSKGFHGRIKLLDLNPESIKSLENKYGNRANVEIKESDFVFEITTERFDRIIANPPYGAYQTPEKRKQLKALFPNVYAKETYGVFLIKALELLDEGGKLVFIIPDTYLTLHMHEGLRKELIGKYEINSITKFPSKFFPGVNFGYAGLSIIDITKSMPRADHSFRVFENLQSERDFEKMLSDPQKYESYKVDYATVRNTPSYAFLAQKEEWVKNILQSSNKHISDVCDVVTGFYSGNDGLYLRRARSVKRGVKKYHEISDDIIADQNLRTLRPLSGLAGKKCWIPIVKGGNTRFHKPNDWYMNWSKEAVHDYRVTNKKRARFQNSQYYFCDGLAIPMVSSSAITASMINGRLFDQSIVGVFPKEQYSHLIYYLLGFFNSKVCNTLIRTLNGSTNNSSNYIKKIPLIIPCTKELNAIDEAVRDLVQISHERQPSAEELRNLDSLFEKIYKPS